MNQKTIGALVLTGLIAAASVAISVTNGGSAATSAFCDEVSSAVPEGALASTAAQAFRFGVWDEVNVGAAVPLFVAYSARTSDGLTADNDVTMTALQVDATTYLLFGTGYGDGLQPGTGARNLKSAAFDAGTIDRLVRTRMGISTPQVRVAATHGHGDHVGPEMLRELRALGHVVLSIGAHIGDQGIILAMPWTAQDLALMSWYQGKRCATLTESGVPIGIQTLLGPVFFQSRPGHTPGSVDLVLDPAGDTKKRVVMLGSKGTMPCSTLAPKAVRVFQAHGHAQ